MLTARRCRSRKEDIVPAIDDVRNGLLLTASYHKLLRQYIAFLPVRLTQAHLGLIISAFCPHPTLVLRRAATELRHGLQ